MGIEADQRSSLRVTAFRERAFTETPRNRGIGAGYRPSGNSNSGRIPCSSPHFDYGSVRWWVELRMPMKQHSQR